MLSTGPGSFIEARKIAPLLAEGAEGQPSFHVVALSLPGFGFSEQPHKRGFAIPQYGEVSSGSHSHLKQQLRLCRSLTS